MAREQLGTATSRPADEVTKAYVDAGDASALVLNVKTYGAVGDGVADDSAAFEAVYAYAAAHIVSDIAPSPHGTVEIYLPPGTYKIVNAGAMMKDLSTSTSRAVKYRGSGRGITNVVFSPSTSNQFLFDNEDDWLFLTVTDITFSSTVSTASWMKSYSNGHGLGYHVFDRVSWEGTWKYGLDLTGTDNNDHMTWNSCNILGSWTSFLHAGTTSTSDQFLEYNFLACHVEQVAGDFIDMALGGSINVFGGSFIHLGNGSSTTSSAQAFFKLGVGETDPGSTQLMVEGIRVEHRHQNSQLIRCDWYYGIVSFKNCDTSPMQAFLPTPDTLVQAEFGGTWTPQISFENCMLLGVHKYHYNAGSAPRRSIAAYKSCTMTSVLRARDFVVDTNDDATGSVIGKAVVRFEDCWSSQDITTGREVFDCTINGITNATAYTAQKKVVTARHPWGGQDFVGLGVPTKVNLPINAIITRVTASQPVGGGVETSTTFTYTVTDDDSTQIAQITGGGAAWNAGWNYDSGVIGYRCTTNNKRKLSITAANTTGSTIDTLILIEYVA